MFKRFAEGRRGNSRTLEAWFATHPSEEDRIAATSAWIGRFRSRDWMPEARGCRIRGSSGAVAGWRQGSEVTLLVTPCSALGFEPSHP
jgi:hypothetical protein